MKKERTKGREKSVEQSSGASSRFQLDSRWKRRKQPWNAFLHLPRSTVAAIMEYLKFSSGKHTWDTGKFSGKEAGWKGKQTIFFPAPSLLKKKKNSAYTRVKARASITLSILKTIYGFDCNEDPFLFFSFSLSLSLLRFLFPSCLYIYVCVCIFFVFFFVKI